MIIFQLLQFNTQFILNTHVTVQHVQKGMFVCDDFAGEDASKNFIVY